jgi:hypothetical protein
MFVEVVMRKMLGMAVLCVAFAGLASADGRWDNFHGSDGYTNKVSWGKDAAAVASAPEMDPASALSALTLLVGGVAVMRGRRK